jgi:hypothetical protein
MSDLLSNRANDGFEAYYAYKLRAWIPDLYWNNDLGDDSLKHWVDAIAQRTAELRREIDRVWAASSIELADDWAVAFLAELVGAEPLSAQNARANRVTAANMTTYHARKTTRYLLDQFITDIVGSEGYIREIERWLARAPHLLDMEFSRRAPLTGTVLGGFPDISGPRVDDARLPAFDEFTRLADPRSQQGQMARFNFDTVHFNLFPFETYRLDRVSPLALDDTHFTLDPSGREAPLFHSASFDHHNGQWPVGPEEFPLPMCCARFNDAQFMINETGLAEIANVNITNALSAFVGITFQTRQDLRRIVADALSAAQMQSFWGAILRESAVDASPKQQQIASDIHLNVGPTADTNLLDDHQIMAGNLETWITAGNWPDLAELIFDPKIGAVQFPDALNPVADPVEVFQPHFWHHGVMNRVGAGGFERASNVAQVATTDDVTIEPSFAPASSGAHELTDNRRYAWAWNGAREHLVQGEWSLTAADQTRPYLASRSDAGTLDFTIRGDEDHENHLVIDGVWLGVLANAAIEDAVAGADTLAPITHARLIIDGTFETITMRHVTIDPGGEQIRLDPQVARTIPAITTEIEGSVKSLRIENAILGPIVETRNDASLLNAGEIRIENSIIQSIDQTRPALSTQLGTVYIENSTILGACDANRIYATNTIFAGPLSVTNSQMSCLRYCAVGDYTDMAPLSPSVFPKRFECTTFAGPIPETSFASRRFGDPDFAVLSPLADERLFVGGELRTEIGVGNTRYWNQRIDDLSRFVSKFMPLGQRAQFFEDIGGKS